MTPILSTVSAVFSEKAVNLMLPYVRDAIKFLLFSHQILNTVYETEVNFRS